MRPWIDRHAVKLLVILLALLICVPTYLVYEYTTTVSDVAEEAKTNSQTNRRLAREGKRVSERLTAGLIESCETNGNPLRDAVRTLLQEQIAAAQRTPPSFLPNIPIEEFERLIQEGIRSKQRAIVATKPVDCTEQYSRP